MIKEAVGNLLSADTEALVNTVNTVGVMGKGIALQFKRAYPDNFRTYQAACKKGNVRLGQMLVYETGTISGPKYIINFPTKNHWKSRAKLADIQAGLQDLRQVLIERGIKSVAVPPLGCGNGGLDWADVYPLIRQALDDLLDIDVLIYPPSGAPHASSMPIRTKRPAMTRARAALLLAFERYSNRSVEMGLSDTGVLSIIEAQKIAYFLQFSGWGTKWDFTPSYFGPYAQAVNQFISGVEGHFIHGYGDGSTGSKATLTLNPEALTEAHELLDDDSEYQSALQRFEEIIDGFEFPYGIELLSTVHYVIDHEDSPPPVDRLVEAINSWSKRKGRLFKKHQAELAYRHLLEIDAVEPIPSA